MNDIIKLVIAEDDLQCKNFLKEIIQNHGDIKIVGEAENGNELIHLVSSLRPHAVIADIEMPELNGMSAIKKLNEMNQEVLTIFVTAYSDFAVDAFEVSSVDFIVKPYSKERIGKALEKIRYWLNARDKDYDKLNNIVKSSDKLFIKFGHEIHFIDSDTIYFIEKERKKTVINTENNRYETFETMNELEKRLNPNYFFRSHKCYIINLKKIEKIIPWGSDSYLIKFFYCNSDALISRSKVKILHELLGIY